MLKKKTLMKVKHFLLMDFCKILNINEYESNRLLIKVLKHDQDDMKWYASC